MKKTLALLVLCLAVGVFAQDAPRGQQGRPGGERRRMMGPGVGGEITAVSADSITLKTMEGGTATVKLSSSTQFRVDREPAKASDFKVGDMVFVGGESAGKDTWNAQFVAKHNGGPGGPGGPGGGPGQMREMLGKRFIAGEVTKIEETKLTIKRIDGETQVIEADENTSFRNNKRESITLADIKVGDKISGRGELKDGVFVPANLNVGELPMFMRRGPEGGPDNSKPEKQN